MPTGFTADVGSGKITDFREYALLCARAFGATIMMRDEPLNVPIPDEFQPDDYYLKKIEICKDKLKELEAMTKKQRVSFVKKEIEKNISSDKKILENVKKENKRYDDMIKKVEKYVSPTPDHDNFKKFMKDQLEISKSNTMYYERTLKEDKPKTNKEYEKLFEDYIKMAKEDIEYNIKHNEEEIKRTKQRNEWVRALRESLKETK